MTDMTMTPAEVLRLFWRQTRMAAVPLTVVELGERMGIKRPSSSLPVRSLIEAGYLVSVKDGAAENQRVYSVTEKGEAVLRRAHARQVAA